MPIFAFAEEVEPQSLDEAVSGRLKNKWQEAMREEMDSLEQNATYELVELPAGLSRPNLEPVQIDTRQGPLG